MDEIAKMLIDIINTYTGVYAALILSAIGLFSAIATFLPAPKEGGSKVYKAVYAVFSYIACNFGKAKNKTS